MTSLTINIAEDLKNKAQKKAKKDGVTLTFIVVQALQAYEGGKLKFGLVTDDNDITATFDVTTAEGKKACLENFKALG